MLPIRRWDAAIAAAIGLAVLAIYVLRLNSVVGSMVDDAWYVVLAQALAEGSGFRLISSATTALQPLYPPGFPALLSLAFQIDPEFPHNVWLLKSVSIAAMMGVGLMTYDYLRRCRQLDKDMAICIAIAVTITPAFVFLATSTVMSECIFTLAQLATVLVVHRTADTPHERGGRNLAILAAVLAGAAVLIRSAALALVLASIIWLLKERRWRRAGWFGGVVALCVMPWMVYSRVNAPTAAERAAHGGAVVYEYVDQLSMRWAGAPLLGRIEAHELPERVRVNFVDVFARGVGGILLPTIFRDVSESGEEVISLVPRTGFAIPSMGAIRETLIISTLLSAIAFLGFVRTVRERVTVAELLMPFALGIIMLWPFWSFRFVVPLTPFLLFYFTRGIQVLAPRAAGIVLLSLIGLNLYDHAGYIIRARSADGVGWVAQAKHVDALLDWINRGGLPEDGVLVATNPGLVYLKTGRKAIASDHPAVEWNGLKRRGARYLAVMYPFKPPSGEFKVLYHSSAELWVVEL